MFIPPRAYVFISCNAVRVLSVIALLLVFASNIVVMVEDIKAVKNGSTLITHTDSNGQTELIDCDYFDNSTVPNQPAGVFWAVINRLFIIAMSIVMIMSEVGWPSAFFTNFLPILGPDFGVGILGGIQWITSASILSHHVDSFPLVSAFFLFVIGCLNILLGLIFRKSIKDKRSITTFRQAKASELLPSPVQKYGKDIRILQTSVGSVFDSKSEKTGSGGMQSAFGSAFGHGHAKAGSVGQHGQMAQHDTGSTAFGGYTGGYGFARQGEKKAALNGFTLATPPESLPRYHARPPSADRRGSDDSHSPGPERAMSPVSTRPVRI